MKKILLLLALQFITAWSINWLALHRGGAERWGHSRTCTNARHVHGFTRGQTRTCRKQVEVMPHVTHAAITAATTCQRLFQSRRWNCSSILNAPEHTPDLTEGTREQAVVYALSSAAVTWAVARACSQGTLYVCGCGSVPQEPPNGLFKWGGCGDNVKFGAKFAREFVDAGNKGNRVYRIKPVSRHKRATAREAEEVEEVEELDAEWTNAARTHREVLPYMPIFPQDADAQTKNTRGRQKRRKEEKEKKKKKKRKKKKRKKEPRKPSRQNQAIFLMNHHNNRVGRRVVEAALSTQCKCHGVSGSCNIKTCWKALPNFIQVRTQAGERLYRLYLSGVEVRGVSAGPRLRLLPASSAVARFSRDDLIYVTKSPDYCHPEPRLGSLGTVGRQCNATSKGVDGCGIMCCGRGYSSRAVRTHLRCHCKYHWCCYVTCQTCAIWRDIHTCN
ncbi:protein Wnt-11b-like isoform X1 [Penaeus chinensis]|uniref:protein Wnt-11b-like isoform X1 n=2 Tax=Penaeus chinensis TaxID=139456 RepID=UPI001FB609E2|nr:protein Wnt-11b-like isoform X1 [Penaeus chinensis]